MLVIDGWVGRFGGVNNGTMLLTTTQGRARRSLDGSWRAIIDPYDAGYLNLLGDATDKGWFRDFKPRHPGDRVEYDFDTSMELTVPGDWNTQYPELLYYEGSVWYRRTFECDEAEDGRTFCCFGAVNHTARVYLDGRELARHEGGFGPFAVELTGLVGPGRHSLVVMVDNRRAPERIPAMRADWWNFGGLTRSVELVEVPSTFIRDAWVTMNQQGDLVGEIHVSGSSPGAERARFELPDLEIALDVPLSPTGDDSQVGRFELDGSAIQRWAPGAPVLHRVRYQALADDDTELDKAEDDVGFRTVRVEGTRILVNEEPVFLKGISMHAEGPSGGRRASGDEDAATLLGWASDLGANFVRLAHYQHDEAMVRHADRLGLLAWCEVPVYWGIDFANDDTLVNGIEQIDELVIRDRSRASVILWSIANETFPGPDRTAFLSALAAEVRRLDSTRLVTAALLTLPPSDNAVHIDDPLGEVVDVIGVNQYLGWYYGERDDISRTTWRSGFSKPIVFSELGAGAKAGKHGTEDEIWTEEFQAAVYVEQLKMIERCDECAGLSPWILKDFRTPVRVLPGIQDGYNRKGLVSEEGERKLAFDVLRSFYAQR